MYTRAVCLLLHDADREDQVAGTDVVDDVQPLDHPAEAGVAAVEVLRRLAGASSSGSVGTAVRARTSSMETRRGMEERLRERSPGSRVVTES